MGRIAALIVGGIIGAGIMAVTAPKSGKETREQVVNSLNDLKSQAAAANAEGGVEQVVTEFAAKGKDLANDVMAGTEEAVASASARVQDAAADITGTADSEDLKRKIEEARARIVDQVMKNAEESRESVAGQVVTEAEEAAEAVVESVETVVDEVKADVEEAAEAAAPAESGDEDAE